MPITVADRSTGVWRLFGPWPGSSHFPVDLGLARTLACLFRNGTVLDLGAGSGMYGAWFESCSEGFRPRWTGFDGAQNVEAFSATGPPGAFTRHLNLCHVDNSSSLGLFDWAMSLEVAEHLPWRCIPPYLHLLDRSNRFGIVLAWGQEGGKGRGGKGHISPRSREQVAQIMRTLGYVLATNVTALLRMTARFGWLRKDLACYVRHASPQPAVPLASRSIMYPPRCRANGDTAPTVRLGPDRRSRVTVWKPTPGGFNDSCNGMERKCPGCLHFRYHWM